MTSEKGALDCQAEGKRVSRMTSHAPKGKRREFGEFPPYKIGRMLGKS